METKHCNGCDQDKPLSAFYVYKTGKKAGMPFTKCKKCKNVASHKWLMNHRGYSTKRYRRNIERKNGDQPYEVNLKSSRYLGIHVAERALSKFFDNIQRMPTNNPGYDYVCGRGFKIDCKCSCLHHSNGSKGTWLFSINRNTIADYFLCLAFDNRESLQPMHVWLIPGELINTKINLGISNSRRSLIKWEEYERPLARVIACCSEMKTM